jgi:hypothetical protein
VWQKAIILSFFVRGGKIVAMAVHRTSGAYFGQFFFMQLVYRDVAFSWHAEMVFFFFRERNGISTVRLLRMQSDGSLAAKQHGRPVSLAETGRDAVPSWKVVLSWFFFYYHPLDQI